MSLICNRGHCVELCETYMNKSYSAAYAVSDTVASAFPISPDHFTKSMIDTVFTGEQTEVQRGKVTCPESQRKYWIRDSNPGHLAPESTLLTTLLGKGNYLGTPVLEI